MKRFATSPTEVKLLLSVDYEIFGNGDGDIECCVIKPAERIRAIVEDAGGVLTLFVDALEFAAMQEVDDLRYQADKVIAQLQAFVSAGHRVELHLHPQWLNAHWEKQHWSLDHRKWRIGDLSRKDVHQSIQYGMNWLLEVLRTTDPEYRIVAFRAGGWCIQPSANTLKILNNEGIVIDSSVAPSLRETAKEGWFDFSEAMTKPYWRVRDDVCKEDHEGSLWEVPIAVGNLAPIKHLLAIRGSQGGLAQGCRGKYVKGGALYSRYLNKLRKFLSLGKSMLDFCTLDEDTIRRVADYWVHAHSHSINTVLPVVAIGHTKNFTDKSAKTLRSLLDWGVQNEVVFTDYFTLLDAIYDSERNNKNG